MPASSPTSSSRLWFLALPPLALIAGIAGLQLGAVTAPATHEAGFEPPAAHTETQAASRPALALAKPQLTPSATHSYPATIGNQPQQPIFSASPAQPTISADERAERYFARVRAQSSSPVEVVDPYLPGHSISANGQRVFVENSQLHAESGQNALGVVIVPESEPSSSPAFSAPEGFTTPQTTTPVRASKRASLIGEGFTPEELAFRAKWGWEAHNAVLRAAFEAADGAP